MNGKIIKGLVVSSGLGLSACTVNLSDYGVEVNKWQEGGQKNGVELQSRVVPSYDYHFIWLGMREIDYLDRVEYRLINRRDIPMCAKLDVWWEGESPGSKTFWNKDVVRDVTLIAANQTKGMGFYQLPRHEGIDLWANFDVFKAHENVDGEYYCPASDDDDCYITTAMCRDTGKPDDCAELQSLRRYRDEVMLNDSEGRRLVEEYYSKAPKIVSLINQDPDHYQIYQMLRERYITPAAKAADAGENAKALELYKAMVESLSQKYARFI